MKSIICTLLSLFPLFWCVPTLNAKVSIESATNQMMIDSMKKPEGFLKILRDSEIEKKQNAKI